jgi:hypothetical protein
MRALLLLTALLVLAPPARAADEYIESGQAQADLDQAKQHWTQGGIVNYRFTVRRSCFCPEEYTREYTVHVRNGEAVDAPDQTSGHNTVPKLFGLVQSAIDNQADGLHVVYEASGMPAQLDVNARDNVFDEEYSITAKDLAEEDETVPRGVDDSIEDGSAARRLAQARATWADKKLRSYRFRLQLGCFCAPDTTKPRRITVRKGKPVAPPRHLRPYATVPRLFAVIADAIDKRASGLTVKYGKTGMPRSIAVDYDDRAADEELHLTASRLRRLK